MQASFVDGDSGAALPAGVDLTQGLPDRLEVVCYGQGVTTRPLAAVGHGIYAGSVKLWALGNWQVGATLAQVGRASQTFIVGSLRAVS